VEREQETREVVEGVTVMTLRETRSCGHLLRYDTLSETDAATGKSSSILYRFTSRLTFRIARLEICAGFDYQISRHYDW